MKKSRKLVAAISAAVLLSGVSYTNAEVFADTGQETAVENIASAELSYNYKSATYGYRIMCPRTPVGVIPASALFENREGEVLIFENEGYHIKYAWVVLVHAFPEEALPDLNAIDPDEAAELLKKIMGSNGYEGIMLINLSEDNKAIFATTAKEVEIDEDGDGVTDATATADTQMAVLFFRGKNGERYGLELIDNPDLRAASVSALLEGARTMQSSL